MSRRVVLRPEVPGDLDAISRYLEQSDGAVADRFITSVFSALDDLAVMPGKGSPKHFTRPSLADTRSWAVPGFPNHLIYYQPKPEAVVILAVIHGARNVPAVLAGRNP